MKRYECIYIVDPDVSEENRGALSQKVKDMISGQGGVMIKWDEWGNRKLAYEIRKKVRGYYVFMDYCGTQALVGEMERAFRIDDRVLRYMTVLLNPNADPEQILEEMTKTQTPKDQQVPSISTEKTSPAPEQSEAEEEETTDLAEAEKE